MHFRGVSALAAVLSFSSLAAAEVTIKNPLHLDYPEQRVQMLHRIICRVVAAEFHVRTGKEIPVTLVLGEAQQRTVVDELNDSAAIYLERWDEARFAIADTQLAVQRMLTRDRFERIARDVIQRVEAAAPISVNSLRSPKRAVLPASTSPEKCVSGIRESVLDRGGCTSASGE